MPQQGEICTTRLHQAGVARRGGNQERNLCAGHATEGMVDLKHTNEVKCTHSGCTKVPSFAVAGSNKKEICAGHARSGMVFFVRARCVHTQIAASSRRSADWGPRTEGSALDMPRQECSIQDMPQAEFEVARVVGVVQQAH